MAMLDKRIELVTQVSGRRPTGYVAPWWEFSTVTNELLLERVIPAHSRGHQFVTRYPKASDISSPPCLLRLLPAGANRRVGHAPTGKRRLVTAHPQSCHSLRALVRLSWL
jgi:hypothetical protein